jgi:hypothetical protein
MTPKPRDGLAPPAEDLRSLDDPQRKIAKPAIFSLDEIKQHVQTRGISAFNIANPAAGQGLIDLNWRLSDLCNFISHLGRRHHYDSEWCYGSGPGAQIAYPADAYVMGFHRIRNQEWLKQEPLTYFKFSFDTENNTIEVFSLHPSKIK